MSTQTYTYNDRLGAPDVYRGAKNGAQIVNGWARSPCDPEERSHHKGSPYHCRQHSVFFRYCTVVVPCAPVRDANVDNSRHGGGQRGTEDSCTEGNPYLLNGEVVGGLQNGRDGDEPLKGDRKDEAYF